MRDDEHGGVQGWRDNREPCQATSIAMVTAQGVSNGGDGQKAVKTTPFPRFGLAAVARAFDECPALTGTKAE